AGLPAVGEITAREAGLVTSPLPDVLGRDREQFAGRHTLVVGGGHSAANTLLALGHLSDEEPSTRISWAIRDADPASVYCGSDHDGLSASVACWKRLRRCVQSEHVDVHTLMAITGLESPYGFTITGTTPEAHVSLQIDRVIPTTGFRPILDFLREVRLDLDPV